MTKDSITKAKLRGQNAILTEWKHVLLKEAKQQKIEICQLRKAVDSISMQSAKYEQAFNQRLDEERMFDKLPWWRKMFFQFHPQNDGQSGTNLT